MWIVSHFAKAYQQDTNISLDHFQIYLMASRHTKKIQQQNGNSSVHFHLIFSRSFSLLSSTFSIESQLDVEYASFFPSFSSHCITSFPSSWMMCILLNPCFCMYTNRQVTARFSLQFAWKRAFRLDVVMFQFGCLCVWYCPDSFGFWSDYFEWTA